MDVIEALKTRYTARAYTPQPLDKETVQKIIEAARWAPSWANTQPWEIYVAGGEVTERIRQAFLERLHQGVPRNSDLPFVEKWPDTHKQRTFELSSGQGKVMGIDRQDAAARQAFVENNLRFFGAPAVVYLCMDRTLTSWSIFDLGMMAQSIMLSAREYGIDSSVAVNLVAYPDIIRAELGIPDSLMVVIGVALGHSDTTSKANGYRSTRRPLDEVAHFKGL